MCRYKKNGICQLVGKEGKKEKCPYSTESACEAKCRHYRKNK